MTTPEWHAGLRAWTLPTTRSTDVRPLSAAESELSVVLIDLRDRTDPITLFGPEGTFEPLLFDLLDRCGLGGEQVATTIVEACRGLDAVRLERGLHAELREIWPNRDGVPEPPDTPGEEQLRAAAQVLADATTVLNLLLPPCQLCGIVTTLWLTSALARYDIGIVLRESDAQLASLQRVVGNARDAAVRTEGPQLATRELVVHLFAQLKIPLRRTGDEEPPEVASPVS